MQAPSGGYWSTLDADSEGHEGKFYVWDREPKCARCCRRLSTTAFARRFGLDRDAELRRPVAPARLSLGGGHRDGARHRSRAKCEQRLADSARRSCSTKRNARVWPGRDEKILTSWNGLAIAGMAVAARALGRARLRRLGDARRRFHPRAAVARRSSARRPQGRPVALRGVSRRLRLPARRADRAAADPLAQRRPAVRDRRSPMRCSSTSRTATHGGFFFTADDHEQLMHRSKSFGDEAVPAGNGDRGPGADAARAAAG